MYQARQSDYEVHEYSLESCEIITIHKFKPVDCNGSKLIYSYDVGTGLLEGYQILFGGKNDVQIVHAAFDMHDHLVKIDLRIPISKLPNLELISPNLEKIFAIKNLLKSSMTFCRGFNGTKPNVHVQLYKNGSSSIEFVNIYDVHKFFDCCRENELLTDKQIIFCRKKSGCNMFSVKFKWVDDKMQKKLYHRATK